MKGLAICLLALLSALGAAQDQFPDVPDYVWRDHEFERKLSQFGFRVRILGGRREERGRFEARLTLAILEALPEKVADYSQKLQKRLPSLGPRDADLLEREFNFIHTGLAFGIIEWVNRYGKEIEKLGINLKKIQKDIWSAERVLDEASEPIRARLVEWRKDLVYAEGLPIYKTLAAMKAEGLLPPSDPNIRHSRSALRISIARDAIEAAQALQKFEWDDSFFRFAAELTRTLSDVKPQVRQLGWHSETLIGDIKALCARSKPFPDVEKGHWTAATTNKLRQLGIFVGYPDGKFRG